MSDTRRVEFDTKRVTDATNKGSGLVMRALLDTQGMPTNERASFLLGRLMQANHRGPTDTWSAARDRTARKVGLDPSMAKRIWQRWRTMTDVSGDALIKLMLAYDAMCQRNEEAADAYKVERLNIRASNETSSEPVQTGMGACAPRD